MSILIKQTRLGYGGKEITICKFRTMRKGSEDGDPFFDKQCQPDPRITKFGKLLRFTGLDELPQILNVARGEMALVGPRPVMPKTVALYPKVYTPEAVRKLQSVKPGLVSSSYADTRTSDESRLLIDLKFVEEKLNHPVWAPVKYFFMVAYNLTTGRVKNR